MSALSPSQQTTILFSVYQNNTLTIRCLVSKRIHPASQHIILKIVGFLKGMSVLLCFVEYLILVLAWSLFVRSNCSLIFNYSSSIGLKYFCLFWTSIIEIFCLFNKDQLSQIGLKNILICNLQFHAWIESKCHVSNPGFCTPFAIVLDCSGMYFHD